MFECTKTLDQYTIVEAAAIPLDAPGLHNIGAMQVEVIDGVDDFVALMQELFNFDQIRDLLRSDFPLAFDAMHAVTGPYATRLFEVNLYQRSLRVAESPNGFDKDCNRNTP